MATETISGKDVLVVQTISGLLPYAESTQMKGQFYRRYNFNGKVFISNDENFYNELESGGIESINIDRDKDDKLSMVGFITYKKLIGQKRNNVQLEAITVDDFKPKAIASTSELEKFAGN